VIRLFQLTGQGVMGVSDDVVVHGILGDPGVSTPTELARYSEDELTTIASLLRGFTENLTEQAAKI
jgi:hypothetical protein